MATTTVPKENIFEIIIGQDKLVKDLNKIFKIFMQSKAVIRPHFLLTGPSGSGKSHTISTLCAYQGLGYLEINAAALTKEGTSGNSLSKALSPLMNHAGKPCICFVDEFDKLFIAGNSNTELAHESTTGVQNEFLKVLESDQTQVFGDYGKYVTVNTKNVLFVFAGAFNGEKNIGLDRLRELGLKTEFLGRCGLVYNTQELSLEALYDIIEKSPLLRNYLELFDNVNREDVVVAIRKYVKKEHEMNTLGARLVNTLINQYFINGGLKEEEVEQISFQHKLSLND